MFHAVPGGKERREEAIAHAGETRLGFGGMPPPKPKPPGRQTAGGMPPPEHRGKGPSKGAGSSGGGMPPKQRGTGPSRGGGLPPKDRATGKAAAAACASSSGEIPLANIFNVVMGDPPGINEPTTTTTATTGPLRVAGENKYSRARSNNTSSPRLSSLPRVRSNTSSSPRDSYLRTGQQLRSTSSSCRCRFSLLSIGNVDPHSSPSMHAASGITSSPGCRESGARHRTMKPDTGLSSREMAQTPRLTQKAGTGLSTETTRKHRTVAGLNGETPQKNQAVTGPNGEMQKEHRIKHKLGEGSSREMPQKTYGNKSKVRTGEPDADEKRRLMEEMMKNVQEVDRAIQELNELGLGEDISNKELQRYSELLPCDPPPVDTSLELDDEQLRKLQVRHILYRIKYFKLAQQGCKNEPCDAKLDDDCPLYHFEEELNSFDETKLNEDRIVDYLHKQGVLRHIESDNTFDWTFHFDRVAGLDDYQCIVLQRYGDCEYVHWDSYRKYFHKYETELEYLGFWKELLKKLKWMEDYLDIDWSSLKWRRISSRGASQAIKIATGFSKITESLAHAAYYECLESMNMDIYWYKELDGVYFEIWKRVTKLKKSFREALDEVYKLNKFPLRQHRMKNALEGDGSEMEKEFNSCIAGITEGVTEDKAQELIAGAFTELVDRPRFYAQYIKRKVDIARAIGVIPAASP